MTNIPCSPTKRQPSSAALNFCASNCIETKTDSTPPLVASLAAQAPYDVPNVPRSLEHSKDLTNFSLAIAQKDYDSVLLLLVTAEDQAREQMMQIAVRSGDSVLLVILQENGLVCAPSIDAYSASPKKSRTHISCDEFFDVLETSKDLEKIKNEITRIVDLYRSKTGLMPVMDDDSTLLQVVLLHVPNVFLLQVLAYIFEKYAGALDINAINENGDTAISFAICDKNDPIACFLYEKGATLDDNDFLDAIKYGCMALVKAVLDNGGDPETTNELGENALEFALASGNEGMIALLSDAIKQKAGRQTLDLKAPQDMEVEEASFLIDLNKTPDAPEGSNLLEPVHKKQKLEPNHTPILGERFLGKTSVMKQQKIWSPPSGGVPPTTARYASVEALLEDDGVSVEAVFQFLNENQRDVNMRFPNGDTLLHRAAQAQNAEVIKALLKLGANIKIANHNGKYPQDLLGEELASIKEWFSE